MKWLNQMFGLKDVDITSSCMGLWLRTAKMMHLWFQTKQNDNIFSLSFKYISKV